MTQVAAIKEEFNGGLGEVYDEALHRRFLMWKAESGKSLQAISVMLDRSTTLVSQYINEKYPGDVVKFEEQIRILLDRHENLQFVSSIDQFCATNISKFMWEVLQFCDAKCKMGAVLAPSGSGKTCVAVEYKKKNPASILMTADITKTRPGTVIRKIASLANVKNGGSGALSDLLDGLVERLRGSKRLIVIDDAHFLSWEAFEAVRKVHDCARVGVVYLGQERMYEQMKGTEGRAYLFDQIYRRIAIKRDKFRIIKADSQLIADSLCPGLDEACHDFLHEKAQRKGRFGNVENILEVAQERSRNYAEPINLKLLQEADQFLLAE